MKKGKRIGLLLMLLFLIGILAGCSSPHVYVETDLTLNRDYSGEREITLTIEKKKFDKYFDGTMEQLEAIVSDYVPKEFEWTSLNEENHYQYILRLPFDSIDDYREKAKTIIGGEALITMEEPDSIFASGIYYKEDFTSHDMLGWFEQALQEQEYLERDAIQSLIEERRTTVIYKKKEYHAKGGAISIDNVVETPLERLDILTQYFQNEECSRQIVFSFTDESMSRNGDTIREYLEACIDKNTSGVWTENGSMQYFTVTVEKLNAEELDAFMKRVLNSEESFVSKKILHESNVFHASAQWNEYLDLSAFAYSENYRIPLGYYVQWEDGVDFSVRNQGGKGNLELFKSDVYGGYQTVIEKEVSDVNLVVSTKSIYTVQEIEVNTKIKDRNQAERTTTLLFARTPDSEKQKMIRKSIAQLAQGYAEVVIDRERENGVFAISIIQNNTFDKLNEGFEKIFGVRGTLSHTMEGQLTELKHEGSFSDVVDYTGFIENDPLQTILTYNLELASGETIKPESVSSTATLKEEKETVDVNIYSCSIPGAYMSLTFNSTAMNPHAQRLLAILGCIGILLFAIIVICVSMGRRSVNVKHWRERYEESKRREDAETKTRKKSKEKKKRSTPIVDKMKSFFKPDPVEFEEGEFEANSDEAAVFLEEEDYDESYDEEDGIDESYDEEDGIDESYDEEEDFGESYGGAGGSDSKTDNPYGQYEYLGAAQSGDGDSVPVLHRMKGVPRDEENY